VTPECEKAIDDMETSITHYDFYNMYKYAAIDPNSTCAAPKSKWRQPYRKAREQKACKMGKAPGDYGEFFLEMWLNKNETRNALHIPDEVQPWQDCVADKWWNYTELPKGSIYAWKALKDDGSIKMLKFSGDMDGVVPTPGTINWINAWLDEANSTIAPEQEAWAAYNKTD